MDIFKFAVAVAVAVAVDLDLDFDLDLDLSDFRRPNEGLAEGGDGHGCPSSAEAPWMGPAARSSREQGRSEGTPKRSVGAG